MATTLYGCGLSVTIDPDDTETPVVVRSQCGKFHATFDYALKFGELIYDAGETEVDDALELSIRQEHWLIDQQEIMEGMLYDGPVGPPNA